MQIISKLEKKDYFKVKNKKNKYFKFKKNQIIFSLI